MKNKFLQQNHDLTDTPLFNQPWWLDATCEAENWDMVYIEKNSDAFGFLTYFYNAKSKSVNIGMPPLTQNMGLYLNYPKNQKYETKLAYEKKIITELISLLPKYGSFRQRLNSQYTNWLPFFWQGFQQTTRYTYIVEPSNEKNLWDKLSGRTRTDIRKAQKTISVVESEDIKTFYELNKRTYLRQGIDIPYGFELVKRVHEACLKNKASKMFFAYDEDNNLHAAIYLAWDNKSVYYLMGGIEQEYIKNSSAMSLLIYESILFAHKEDKLFDFEGSMVENIEKFFRSFGSVQTPYHVIFK